MADTETENTAENKAAKRAFRQVTKRLARAMHKVAWNAENPKGSAEDRKAAFAANADEHLAEARALRKVLKKSGVVLCLEETTAEAN